MNLLKFKTSFMMNKIFVFGGLALAAILVVENMVSGMTAYVFIDSSAKSWTLSLVSIIVGIFIGFGLKGMLEKDNGDNDNYDF